METAIVNSSEVDPSSVDDNSTEAAAMISTYDNRTLKTKTLQELTDSVNRLRSSIDCFGRKIAVNAFRAGAILSVIKKQLATNGGWVKWQEENDWNRGTALRYIKLFETAKTEKRLGDMTINEAEEKWFAPKKKKQAQKPSPNSDSDSSNEDNSDSEQPNPVIVSPIAESRDHLSNAYEALSVLEHGERNIDQQELAEVKLFAQKLLALVETLEQKAENK